MCLLMGIIGVMYNKDTLNFNFIFMYLLTGVLSGILVIIAYVRRMVPEDGEFLDVEE